MNKRVNEEKVLYFGNAIKRQRSIIWKSNLQRIDSVADWMSLIRICSGKTPQKGSEKRELSFSFGVQKNFREDMEFKISFAAEKIQAGWRENK